MAEVHNIEKSHIQKCLIHISKKLLLIILSTATWTKFESNFKDVIILDKGVKDTDWQFPVGGSGGIPLPGNCWSSEMGFLAFSGQVSKL